ncbi:MULTISPECIES: hypothetical protein [Streptomyces]|uniref:Uncharacterized protein n=1 Tax=Streptomyces doebereineriae TaxID=3075528 RepID=A0ABU2V4L3_9ACTN|nr:hypothetical protein [Streptomyces sp. DSM 41640]MDT0480359.1 hypothetical protein [Streptomyces sp. DSM 41640]
MRGYWRNVPGPFYGAATDSTMLGHLDALRQISRPESGAQSVGGAAEALGVQAAR